MKKIGVIIAAASLLAACNNRNHTLVDAAYGDSLNIFTSPLREASDSNIVFWKKRMDSLPENFVNGPEYAAALYSRFKLYGNINDLLSADSLYQRSNEANQNKEPGIYRTLTSLAMTRHRFAEADSLLQKAIAIDGQSIPNSFLRLDIAFERGDYRNAKSLLESLKTGNDNSYAYLFRESKMEHYDGSLDTAISCMLRASEKANGLKSLRQAALSNAADLYIHKGNLDKALELYQQSISIDVSDLHSIMGMGWAILMRDKNDSLAEKLFNYVQKHSSSPDVLLRFWQLAEFRGDSVARMNYAAQFSNMVSDPKYGRMYSKYLIDLYTSVSRNPSAALTLATDEINNRISPQVFAWYAWALFCNNEKDKAYSTFKTSVSGKPLEGLELYYMGRMLKEMGKGYDAGQYFKAAWKNRYDLSPDKQEYIGDNL